MGRNLLRYTDRAFSIFTGVTAGSPFAQWIRRAIVARVLPRVFRLKWFSQWRVQVRLGARDRLRSSRLSRYDSCVRVPLIAAILFGAPGIAVACPFCGGKGASGLLENLLLVAALWFGARALMRSMQRRRQKQRRPETEARDDR